MRNNDYQISDDDFILLAQIYYMSFKKVNHRYYLENLDKDDIIYLYNNELFNGQKVVTVSFTTDKGESGGSRPCYCFDDVLSTVIEYKMKLKKELNRSVEQLSLFDL